MSSFETGGNHLQPIVEGSSIVGAAHDYTKRYPKLLTEYPGVRAHGDIVQINTAVEGNTFSVFNPGAFGVSEMLSESDSETQTQVKKGVENIKFTLQRKLGHIAIGGGASGVIAGTVANSLTDAPHLPLVTGLTAGLFMSVMGTPPIDKNLQYKKATKAVEEMAAYFSDEAHGGIWFYRSRYPKTLSEYNSHTIQLAAPLDPKYSGKRTSEFMQNVAKKERNKRLEIYNRWSRVGGIYEYRSSDDEKSNNFREVKGGVQYSPQPGVVDPITIAPGLLVEYILSHDANPNELWHSTAFGKDTALLSETHFALKRLKIQQQKADALDTFTNIHNEEKHKILAREKAHLDETLLSTSLEMIDIHYSRIEAQAVKDAEAFLYSILGDMPQQSHPHEMILQDVYTLAAKAIAELDISNGDTHAHATELGRYLNGMRTHLAEEQDLPQLYQGFVLKFSGHFPGLVSWEEAKQTYFGNKFALAKPPDSPDESNLV